MCIVSNNAGGTNTMLCVFSVNVLMAAPLTDIIIIYMLSQLIRLVKMYYVIAE